MSGPLITAAAGAGLTRIAEALVRQADAVARARRAARILQATGDARRWRSAALLWPNGGGQEPWK
ncbi:hypothetical protein [Novosphingobium colocasiae]|uniref:hypothetical protein n=1 Tax=Novosphingobium colocasiae TaxID=1256513 RepID=UPI0035AF4D4B